MLFKDCNKAFCKGHSEDTKLPKTFRNVSCVLQGYEHTEVGLYKGQMNKFSLVLLSQVASYAHECESLKCQTEALI